MWCKMYVLLTVIDCSIEGALGSRCFQSTYTVLKDLTSWWPVCLYVELYPSVVKLGTVWRDRDWNHTMFKWTKKKKTHIHCDKPLSKTKGRIEAVSTQPDHGIMYLPIKGNCHEGSGDIGGEADSLKWLAAVTHRLCIGQQELEGRNKYRRGDI